MKAAIIYYSLEGNTELIANMISKRTGAELIKLMPKKEIAKDGFKKFFWGGKSVVFKEKPELLNHNIQLKNYDTLIIGTPIWAGSFAPPLLSFLSSYEIKGKKLHLYACNSGGETQKCFRKLEDKLMDNTIISTAGFQDPTKLEMKKLEKLVDAFCEKIKEGSQGV